MPNELTPEQRGPIIAAIYAGQKIPAIKLYREATGAGLAESKTFVEALEKRLREETPDQFASPKQSGCGAALVLLAALTASASTLGIMALALLR